MTEFYKLLFDMTLYYEIFGFYFKVIFRVKPCVGGFLLLVTAVLLDIFLRSRDARHGVWKYLPLVLPAAIFYYRPSLWQFVEFVPIWVYTAICIHTDRINTGYDEFKDHFAFAGKLHFAFLPGIASWERFPGGLLTAAPYLILMLAMGVCMLRMLREKENNGKRQLVYIAVFILVGALLTIGRAPQVLMQGVGFVYNKVIAPILYGAAMAVTAVGYVFVIAARWLLSLRKGSGAAPGGTETPPAWYDASRTYEVTDIRAEWLKYVLIGIAAILAVGALILILRKMLGEKYAAEPEKKPEEVRTREEEKPPKPHSVLGIRPHDPRMAVRFYYGKFLAECAKRGEELPVGLTATELVSFCTELFPGADPAALTAIYSPARYSSRESVTPEDADRAADAWRVLKRTKLEKK